MSVQTEPSNISITLPELSTKIVDRKFPALSGICPSKTFLYMFGISIALNLALGFLVHHGGAALNWLGINLGVISTVRGVGEFLQTWLKDAAAIALYAGIGAMFVAMVFRGLDVTKSAIVGIVSGLVLFLMIMIIPVILVGMGFIYCVAIGLLCALITISQGVRGHCRNTKIYVGVSVLSGSLIYGVHVLLVLLEKRDFYPIGLPVGTPWIVGTIEASLIILVAATLSPSIVARLRYCETHSVWYERKWKEGRFLADQEAVNAIYRAVESQSVEGFEIFSPLTEETYPYLVIKARDCPKNGCDVELLVTLYQIEKDSKKEQQWFRIMVPGLLGKEFIRLLNLQKDLPPLERPKKPTSDSA